ncbi:very short patch repair endonuclease [Arthrobacter sp. B3I4]|uniref:very short patch repair endonuclease n=1 Tax=Arthrobacter sp. B3I4 TaxID=3042267 RepID=UPI0027D87107|nr:very short patch repair endonuclease [Arthrobacter sp. B3I4]
MKTRIESVTDFMSAKQRSAHMAKIRSKDTKPELLLRKALHTAGYRYRIHDRRLPGKPDLVFAGRRKVVFVNGCFWHGHRCSVGDRLPKSNTEFWAEKRRRNQSRDEKALQQLEALGWESLVVWECEVNAGQKLIEEVKGFLDE